MKAYKFDPLDSNSFIEEVEAQLDPRATERTGEDVWMLPADCTFIAPPTEKDGFVRLWDAGQEKWTLVENHKGQAYWIQVDGAWESHTMNEYGALPTGAVTERPLIFVKNDKITELKNVRNQKEEYPVTTDKGTFDFDEKSRERINGAIALTEDGETRQWTLADNTVVSLTKADLQNAIKAGAERCDILHNKYRTIYQMVQDAETKEEVEAISWDIINE